MRKPIWVAVCAKRRTALCIASSVEDVAPIEHVPLLWPLRSSATLTPVTDRSAASGYPRSFLRIFRAGDSRIGHRNLVERARGAAARQRAAEGHNRPQEIAVLSPRKSEIHSPIPKGTMPIQRTRSSFKACNSRSVTVTRMSRGARTSSPAEPSPARTTLRPAYGQKEL